ncbi:MAG TPA: hypothetical protein VFO19_08540 [Vicinamibacterales bacterium]|nr:hypothetical protein [Vicinamibacterales bacterium]
MAKRTGKEPFVSKEDRPAVQLKSDTPVNTLTVRDLVTLLGVVGGTRKDFWDGKSWQKDDFDGPIIWKRDIKEQKDKEKEKDFKEGKEHKDHKEKREIKEVKAEKLEVDAGGVLESSPDPRLEQVIRAVSGISAKVDQLADQVAALKKGKG